MKRFRPAALALLLAGAAPGLAAPGPASTAAAAKPEHTITLAMVTAAADRMWAHADANHDGRIDAADRDARMLEWFGKIDTNHDGMISKDEFLAEIHARADRWRDHGDGPPPPPSGPQWPGEAPGRFEPDGHGHEHVGMGWRQGGMIRMAILWPAMAGVRKDGVITRAAFDAAVRARFDRLDTNHDGTLTRDELRAARGAGMPGRGWRHHRGPAGDHGDMPPPPPAPPPAAM
jgi:hypothetical protein